MSVKKNSTRTFILINTLIYSFEPFLSRYVGTDGSWYVDFSVFDLSKRLNCGVTRLEEQLEKASILGALEVVKRAGHACRVRLLVVKPHSPTPEAYYEWVKKWRSYSRGKAPLLRLLPPLPRGSDATPSTLTTPEGKDD